MPGRSGNNGMSHDRTKFTGYLLEEEGEQDTYHAEARGYDPVIGRFTSRDPLEKLYPGVTPFAYAMNNPVRLVDPTGMSPWVFDDSDSDDRKSFSGLSPIDRSAFHHPDKHGENGSSGFYKDYEKPGFMIHPAGYNGSTGPPEGSSSSQQSGGCPVDCPELGTENGEVGWRPFLGPSLIFLGQPILKKPFVMSGSSPGTSIASRGLSQAFPQKFTDILGKKTGTTIATSVGTNTIGRALGRFVPYVGWSILTYDVITMPWGDIMNTYNNNQEKLDEIYGPGKMKLHPVGPKY